MTTPDTVSPPAPPLRWTDFSASAVIAGLIAIVVGFSGPVTIIFTAASVGHLSAAQTSSWLLAASVGSGLIGIALTLRTRMPVVIAWSTPGAALLVTSIGAHPFSDMVGAYVIAAVAMSPSQRAARSTRSWPRYRCRS